MNLNVWTRVASFGLAGVLVSSTAFSIEAAATTRQASGAAKTASALNNDFETARYAVAAEESLERKYRLEPSRGVFFAHRASAAELTAAMQAVQTLGDAQDRFVAEDVLRAHTSYLSATANMFLAVNRRETSLVVAIDSGIVDPVFTHIERAVDKRARTHAEAANLALAHLSDIQQQLIAITIALSALGLLSLGLFLAVLLTYQRRLRASHQAELVKLEHAALTDNLTGIGNHRAFQEQLDRQVLRARADGTTLCLALIDIDDFKVVNDRSGHLYGDHVLTMLAALVAVAGGAQDRAYRVGGDEFAVFLTHASVHEAQETMERLRAHVHEQVFGTTVTIGLATLTGSQCDVETLQAQADAAIYSGQRAGRDSVTAFDASMNNMWLLSPKKIHNLHQLIAAGSMQIMFQPIWDVDEGRVLAYEALARPDPRYGFTGPQEAFDLAERIGRAHELDAVCREAAFASTCDLPDDALLFVNISPQSLDHGRLDQRRLQRVVRDVGLAPARVVFEITERSITQVDAVINAARELQNHGFRLALDDTGAGNSGLEIMSRLTFDFVKIDREVVVQALDDKNARGVLAGIVAIAQTTGAYVIAEGIETAELLNFVCRAGGRQAVAKRGIDGVQGYLLRRPSRTFPKPNENADIAALLKEFALDHQSVL